MKKLITLILILSSTLTFSQSLISDTTFGINSQVASILHGGGGTSTNIFRQSDNKILLCGNIFDLNCNCGYNAMFRTDCAGGVDSAFGINGFVKHTFDQRNSGADYALLPDGKILVAGTQGSGNGSSEQFPSISRYNYDGNPDTTFGTMGTNKVTTLPGASVFYSMFLLPDGKILCSGQQGNNNHLIVRFDSTGAVDTTFGISGVIQHATPAGMTLLNGFTSVMRSDGKIISATTDYFNGLLILSAYDTLGIEDSTFGVNGYIIDNNFAVGSYIPRMLLQSDDKVILAKQNPTETEIRIARYNTDGSIDSTFGTNGYVIVPGNRLENFFKQDNDDFILGFVIFGIGSKFKKYSANGIEITPFSLDGGNTFEFSQTSKANIGIAAANNEFIIATTSGNMAMAKFVETIGSAPSITQSGNTLNANVNNSGVTYQWFLNGNEILNATNSSLDFTQNGTHTVVVTNSWGCESSDDFEVTGVGMHEIESNLITVFPNPASNSLTIQFSNTVSPTTISLYDVIGKSVFEKQISNVFSTQIDVSAFSKGMYTLQIISKEGKLNHKIIVQ